MRFLIIVLASIVLSSVITYNVMRVKALLDVEKANKTQFHLFEESEDYVCNYKTKNGKYPENLPALSPNASEKTMFEDIFYKKTPTGYILVAKLPASGWLISDENTAQGTASNP